MKSKIYFNKFHGFNFLIQVYQLVEDSQGADEDAKERAQALQNRLSDDLTKATDMATWLQVVIFISENL